MTYAPLILSAILGTLGLLFTTFSFWWMNWRRGKLSVGHPRGYELDTMRGENAVVDSLVLRLPLIFYNTGAKPILVQNLRLVLQDKPAEPPLAFTATLEHLASDDVGRGARHLAIQFVVRGREAVAMVYEFWGSEGHVPLFAPDQYLLELQGQLDNQDRWRHITRFMLTVTQDHIDRIKMGKVGPFDNQDIAPRPPQGRWARLRHWLCRATGL